MKINIQKNFEIDKFVVLWRKLKVGSGIYFKFDFYQFILIFDGQNFFKCVVFSYV